MTTKIKGEQHYYDNILFGSSSSRKLRDIRKREICMQNKIALVEIPFWWDGKLESLAASIHIIRYISSFIYLFRPDLTILNKLNLPEDTPSIPIDPPSYIVKKKEKIEVKHRIGFKSDKFMSKPTGISVPEVHLWDDAKDPTGWYVAE